MSSTFSTMEYFQILQNKRKIHSKGVNLTGVTHLAECSCLPSRSIPSPRDCGDQIRSHGNEFNDPTTMYCTDTMSFYVTIPVARWPGIGRHRETCHYTQHLIHFQLPVSGTEGTGTMPGTKVLDRQSRSVRPAS